MYNCLEKESNNVSFRPLARSFNRFGMCANPQDKNKNSRSLKEAKDLLSRMTLYIAKLNQTRSKRKKKDEENRAIVITSSALQTNTTHSHSEYEGNRVMITRRNYYTTRPTTCPTNRGGNYGEKFRKNTQNYSQKKTIPTIDIYKSSRPAHFYLFISTNIGITCKTRAHTGYEVINHCNDYI